MRIPWERTKGAPEPMAALDRIRLIENGEPLVDLRLTTPSVKIARETVIPFLRQSVADMLEQAAHSLPSGFAIGVTDAWRPIERQRRIYEFMLECAKEAFPERSYAAMKRTVNRLVHAYDRSAPPGHCTGAAVDVHLLTEDGVDMDVSAPYDRFSASRTYTLGLEPEAKARRDMLVGAMLNAGFSNCRDEWWHYSFGDAAWAVRLGKPECPYGLIELEADRYAVQERLSEEMFKTRDNPFLQDKGPEPAANATDSEIRTEIEPAKS